MSKENRETHIREVEVIGKRDESESDEMVAHQLPIILPRLLDLEAYYDGLLHPVACLEEVVEFEVAAKCSIWVGGVHAADIEVEAEGGIGLVVDEGGRG